ncbi:S-layer homology domain-containing protein [Paenibacillus yanchengensis]|uniref:S-layer homology domain-containing protein n=1 Tax=Paenibacillus yanchengensis TaxID=2035833 RepID=A0ABW4YH60_9BACL
MIQEWHKKTAASIAIAMTLTMFPAYPSTASAEIAANDVATTVERAEPGTTSKGSNAVKEETNTKIAKNKAEEYARKLVHVPKDYKLQSTSLSNVLLAEGKRQLWNLDFVKKENGKYKGNISVSLDANTGQLLEFQTYLNNPSAKPAYPLKVNRDAAKPLADKFLKQVAAEYIDQLKFNEQFGQDVLPPLTGQVNHTLRYDRIVNGVSFNNNYVMLQINSEGHINGFSMVWDETIKFPKITNYMNAEAARKAIIAAAKPQLKYVLPHNTNQSLAKPILIQELPAYAIDAVTGKVSNPKQYRSNQEQVAEKPLTATPISKKPTKQITDEQAAAKIVEETMFLPKNAELQYSSFQEHVDERVNESVEVWHLEWTIKDGKKDLGSVSATVDAKTGTIGNYHYYMYEQPANETTKPAILSLDEAISKAEATIKKQLPWLTHELYVVKPDPERYKNVNENDQFSYYIEFAHKVHGATTQYDYINVAIDARTGQVASFSSNIIPLDYPSKAPTIVANDQLMEQWLEYYRAELTYRLVQQYWYDNKPLPIEKYNLMQASGESLDKVDTKYEVELVYQLSPRALHEEVWLDATTGKWLNREKGLPTKLELPQASDIKGHWAESQLELMIAYKALELNDGKVEPNKTIKRGELIKMLVLAQNQNRHIMMSETEQMTANDAGSPQEQPTFKDVETDSDYFAYVEFALQQNLIDIGDGSFHPEEPVKREEMAELIVRALGYNTLADHESIFNTNFKDAKNINKKGQVAIVVGLDIMSLTDQKFMPGKTVTRAEASTAFFRYLQQRADLYEAPIRN